MLEGEGGDRAGMAAASERKEGCDRIARLASLSLAAPLCVVRILDGDSGVALGSAGEGAEELPPDPELCAYVAGGDEPFCVSDCSTDDRFSSHPWVAGPPWIKSFAGVPLHDESGDAVGAVCVMGFEPRELDGAEMGILADAAALAESSLRLGSLRGRVAAMEEREARASGEPALASGLWSAEAAMALLRCDLARGERGMPTTLATVAIDGLHEIEDDLGPEAAQALWKGVAQAICACMREFDLVGRDDGDGFWIIMSNTDRKQGAIACERLRKAVLSRSFKAPGAPLRASLSIGAATTVAGTAALDALLDASFAAMAKASLSRNKYISHPEGVAAPEPGAA